MTTIRAARLVTRDAVYEPGRLEVAEDLVVAVGPWTDGTPDLDLTGTVTPGLVDVHGHGGGGESYVSGTQVAIATHRNAGSTSLIASTVTESLDDLETQVEHLAPFVEAGELAGIHLEGPWLSTEYKGAHPAPLLKDPNWDDIDRILTAGRGTVRMVTIAPERPGGIEACAALAQRGVVAAIGHTNADYATTAAALAAGATGATHLFNAMRPIHHREPGPIIALMAQADASLEVIVDGVHINANLVRYLAEVNQERLVLVTDSMAAAGAPEGDYVLGTLEVTVRDGIARIAGTDTIAGSTLTLSKAVRNAIEYGVDWRLAIHAATWRPAQWLSLLRVGDLAPGYFADVVEFDDDWQVSRVMRRGAWLDR